MSNVVTIDYEPREAFIPFHCRRERFSSLVCHRRAGKTVACVNDLAAKAMHTKKKNARFAYVAPFYRQAKDVAWTYLKECTKEIAVKVREADLRVELPNGAWITLYGADNPDALRGLYFDGIILDEFGDCRPALWAEVILPALLDRRGWAVFIGTPKGKNHFFHMNERAKVEDSWYQMTLKASESGLLDPVDLKEIRGQMTPEQYEQEMECSFEAAVQGTYYADIINSMEQEDRMSEHGWDPTQKVNVATDLGYTDSTAMWFWQMDEDGPILIDYEEHSGKRLDFYLDMLEEKKYEYDTLYVPHDAKAGNFQTGRSTIEQFLLHYQSSDVSIQVVPKLKVQHGIDATRKVLPLCRFDRSRCFNGIEALRAYRKSYNEVTRQFSKTPYHDWASNGADAFRYFSLVTQEHLQLVNEEVTVGPVFLKPYEFSLEDLYKAKEDDSWRYNVLRF